MGLSPSRHIQGLARPLVKLQRGNAAASLELHTDHLLPGILRKNGVPYGSQARLTEYWEINSDGGDTWLTVTTVLEDPEYLRYPYTVNSIFRKERDGAQWSPSACTLRE